MPAWVMTSEKNGRDIEFFIGQVKVANICYHNPTCATLRFMDNEPKVTEHKGVSAAMKAMHQYLKSPRMEHENAKSETRT